MNKKLATLILVSALTVFAPTDSKAQQPKPPTSNNHGGTTIINLMPESPNTREGGSGNGLTINAQGTTNNNGGGNLNNLSNQFNGQITTCAQSITSDRVVFLTSAGLGVSLTQLQQDLSAANQSQVTYGNFLLAQIIARQANVSYADVFVQINSGLDFNTIARNYNLSRATIRRNFISFVNVYNAEAGLPLIGNSRVNTIDRVLPRFTRDFDRLTSTLGADRFNSALYQQLSLSTGLTVSEVQNLRASLPATMTSGEFASALLTANSISSINGGGLDLTSLNTSAGISSMLQVNNIPGTLIANRLRFFQLGLDSSLRGSMNNGSGF